MSCVVRTTCMEWSMASGHRPGRIVTAHAQAELDCSRSYIHRDRIVVIPNTHTNSSWQPGVHSPEPDCRTSGFAPTSNCSRSYIHRDRIVVIPNTHTNSSWQPGVHSPEPDCRTSGFAPTSNCSRSYIHRESDCSISRMHVRTLIMATRCSFTGAGLPHLGPLRPYRHLVVGHSSTGGL